MWYNIGMKNQNEVQFTSGKAHPLPDQMDLNFSGVKENKPINFLEYSSAHKQALVLSILDKTRKSLPLTAEETEFEAWNDTFKDSEGQWYH